MATTSPARIDDELYASAKLTGEVQSRSASQQVVHWARIGRELEASTSLSHKDIAQVLAGSRSYDSLSVKEQAVVRAEWAARIDKARDELQLAEQFAAEGRTWVELDDDGEVVERGGRAMSDRPNVGALPHRSSGKGGGSGPETMGDARGGRSGSASAG
ncbi:MAG: hypothetical protein NVSMB4_07230 [Acidimicrobiales bacterium]